MFTMIAAAALAAQAPGTTATVAPASQTPMGQMDHSKMDHSKMDHSKMGQKGDGCCKKAADGKMECSMPARTPSGQQNHSGH